MTTMPCRASSFQAKWSKSEFNTAPFRRAIAIDDDSLPLSPSSDDLLGRMVMAPSAAHSWCRTGWILAPHESEPIQ